MISEKNNDSSVKKIILNSTRLKISLLILFPVLALAIVSYYFVWTNYRDNKEATKNLYLSELKNAAYTSENNIDTIAVFIESYVNNDSLISLLSQDNPDPDECMRFIGKINSAISQHYDIVDGVFLYNRHKDFCVTPDRVVDSKTFFSEMYVYSDYDAGYWNKYNYYYSSLYRHRPLPPTPTIVNGQEKYIQPLIFLQLNDIVIKNFLVVNISFDAILNNVQQDHSLGSNTYVLNNYTGNVFSLDRRAPENIANTELYNNLIGNKLSFDYNDGTQKYYVIAHQKNNSLNSYTYFSMIPYKTLHSRLYRSFFRMFFVLSMTMLAAAVISLKLSRSITTPLENIAARLAKSDSPQSGDLISTISSSLDSISDKNKRYDMLLPYMQEKYLIDFLNSNEYIDYKTQEFLMSTLPFRDTYFAAVIVQLYPLPKFYETYTAIEITNIQTGFYNIVQDSFSNAFNARTLTTEKDVLYIIVNTGNVADATQKIKDLLNELGNMLDYDHDDAVLMTGVGGMYEGYAGLKQSHDEALQLLNAVTTKRPKISTGTHRRAKGVISYKNEELLTNYLVVGNYDAALGIFNNILKENERTDGKDMKNVFSQVLYIIAKIMRSKNMFSADTPELDYKAISALLEKPNNDIKNEILILLSKFKTDYNTHNPTAANIIDYLQSEYSDPNLTLDSVAQVFSISKTYVSSTLKKQLGFTFHEYLVSVRINNAKLLLSSTDIPILEVMNRTGFSNKQTFSRVFKSATGMTALEYRKKYSGK